jgi:Mg2+ and Co2+ transporter CorA
MTTIDHEYFRRREQQERDNADRTDDNTAKRIHLEMADRYADMLKSIASLPPMAQL